MRIFDTTQQAIVDSNKKLEVSWLYQIDQNGDGLTMRYWSHKTKTWNTIDYDFTVIEQSDLQLVRNQSEKGNVSSSSFDFTIVNPNNAFRPSDFSISTKVKVLLVIKADVGGSVQEREIAAWSFIVEQTVPKQQLMQFKCVDPMKIFLTGTYPNTPLISSLWTGIAVDEGACIPKTWGNPYIPCASVATSGEVHYVVGKVSEAPFTFERARTSKDWGGPFVEWLSSTYTFSTKASLGNDGISYELLQVIGADTDYDSIADANVMLESGDSYLSLPVKYGRSASIATTNPVDITYFYLRDIGVPVSLINAASRTASAASCTEWGLNMNFGLWSYNDKDQILSNLLVQSNMELVLRDQLVFKPHTKTSVKNIDRSLVIRTSGNEEGSLSNLGEAKFQYEPDSFTVKREDAGYVQAQFARFPIDKLNSYLVTAKTTKNSIADTGIICNWIGDTSISNPQKIAKLNLQRILLTSGKCSFTGTAKVLDLECDDMVTITPADYGAGAGHEYSVLIDNIKISKKLEVAISGTMFSDTLDDLKGLATPTSLVPYVGTVSNSYSSVTQGPGQSGLNKVGSNVWIGDEILLDGEIGRILVGGTSLVNSQNTVPFNIKDKLYFKSLSGTGGTLYLDAVINILSGSTGGALAGGDYTFGSLASLDFVDISQVHIDFGTLASLDTIDVNDLDFSFGSLASLDSIGTINLIKNPGPVRWTNGAYTNPDEWFSYPSGVKTIRSTTPVKFGIYRVATWATAGAYPTYQYQSIHETMGTPYWNGAPVVMGGWLYCPATSATSPRLEIYDGVSSTFSSYCGRTGNWTWRSVTKTLNSHTSEVTARIRMDQTASAASMGWQGIVLLEGHIAHSIQVIQAPTGTGLILEGNYIGFYRDNAWKVVIDGGHESFWIHDVNFGHRGIQLEYNSGYPRVYFGDGADQYFKFRWPSSSSAALSFKTQYTELDEAGHLKIEGVKVSDWIGSDGSSIDPAKIYAQALSDIVGELGTIVGGDIIGATFMTSRYGVRMQMDSTGIKVIADDSFIYGTTAQGGSNLTYGNALFKLSEVAAIKPSTTEPPFQITGELTGADIRMYNRSGNPTGAANIGDLMVKNGKLYVCTFAATPGTWTVVGSQT